MITVHSLILGASHKCTSGALELTTPLLKLVDILWLPLSRIYKLGYSYPRRLSRSPAVVGYQGGPGVREAPGAPGPHMAAPFDYISLSSRNPRGHNPFS